MNHESGQQYSLFGDVRIMRSKETIDATSREFRSLIDGGTLILLWRLETT